MKLKKFRTLKTFETLHDVKILVGEYFLTGKKVIEQKETKKVGQDISYYKVTKIDGNNISYVMIFDKLEED